MQLCCCGWNHGVGSTDEIKDVFEEGIYHLRLVIAVKGDVAAIAAVIAAVVAAIPCDHDTI